MDHLQPRGPIAAPLLLEVTRDLTSSDLDRLGEAPKVSVPIVQKLRAIHHRQAQLLAGGRTPTEVAAIVGCTVQRLVQLQVDPAFTQLVAYYQDQIMVQMLEDSARLKDKLVDLGEMAVDELRERMEDDERRRKMFVGEVRKIAEFAMDRTVAPPKTAVPPTTAPATVTINFGTSLRPPPPIIDALPEPSSAQVGQVRPSQASAASTQPRPHGQVRSQGPNSEPAKEK